MVKNIHKGRRYGLLLQFLTEYIHLKSLIKKLIGRTDAHTDRHTDEPKPVCTLNFSKIGGIIISGVLLHAEFRIIIQSVRFYLSGAFGDSNDNVTICTFVKAAYSVTFDIFRNFLFSFLIICKSRIKLCFHNKSVHYS